MGSGIYLGESRKMTIRIAVSAAALLGLAACGGGGGTLGGSGAPALIAEFEALEDATPASTFGTGVGLVTYTGAMLVANDLNPASATTSDEGYLGTATMSMDFTNGEFRGKADGFYLVSIGTSTGNPDGFLTRVNADGSVDSVDVEFTDLSVVGDAFTPVFGGSINGDDLDGEGLGRFRDVDGSFVTIVETNGADGFTLNGLAADVEIFADQD